MQDFSVYLKEVQYAFRASRNWRSCAKLLRATATFHFQNYLNRRSDSNTPVALDLRIGGIPRSISVRPRGGDIFILYEVLAWEPYWLPDHCVDPFSVRTVVDCGANIGLTALYFASQYPNARIFSLEPDPKNFALLTKNVESEQRIIPVHAAVVGEIGQRVYLSQDRPAWGNRVTVATEDKDSIEVPAITLRELFERFDLGTVDLLKVDIEGGERDVFAKPSFLSSVKFVVIELHGDYTIDRFRTDVGSAGYDVKAPSLKGPRAVTAYPADRARSFLKTS